MISGSVQWSTQPDIDVFHLRGRLLNSGLPTYLATVSARTSVASMTSSSRMPASGQPSMTRGTSPQASVRRRARPTRGAARSRGRPRCGSSGSCTFCRSVTSATSRPNSVLIPPMTRSCVAGQLPAVDADAQHEVRVLELLGLQQGGLAAGDALGALGVEAHPAHPAAEVAGVDAVEAGLRVDVEDPLPDLEAVGVLLHPLVGVERLAVAQRPLALPALGPGAGAGGVVTVGLLPALAARAAAGRAERGAADRGRSGGRAGGPGSALSATGGAGDERQVDVQTRDEEAAAVGHAVNGATLDPTGWRDSGTRGSRPSMAARMRATDSASGVTEVSMTTSARAGGSYGSLTPVNSRDLAGAGLRVQALHVALLADLERGGQVHEHEPAVLLHQRAGLLAGGLVGRDRRDDDRAAVLDDLAGDPADPPDVEVAVLAGERQLAGEVGADDVAVQDRDRAALGLQLGDQGVGDRGLARARRGRSGRR